MTNKKHCFTLVFEPFDMPLESIEDALFESGCDDALFGTRSGIPFLEFERESRSLVSAVVSAIADVEKAEQELVLVRVEPDDIVNISEIARRSKFSREYIRKLVEGLKGPGKFPTPISGLIRRSPLWRWVEVANWLVDAVQTRQNEALLEAKFIVFINGKIAQKAAENDKKRLIRALELSSKKYLPEKDGKLMSLANLIENRLEASSVNDVDRILSFV